MSDENEPPKSSHSLFSAFAGLALLFAVAGGVWYFVMVKPAETVAQSAMARVERFLGGLMGGQGTITRDDSSSVLKVTDVGEIALMEFEIKVSKDMVHEQVALAVLTSKKRLRMDGKFKVKVGYDITGGLSVGYDEEGRAFIQGLKGPEILSAEMVSVKTVEDTSGLWNKVNKKDRDALVNQLRLQAIRDIKEGGMLEQMSGLMEQNMKAMLGVEDILVREESVLP